ncbi:hypothetical protein SIID45300_01293 [Candidatus Magnetaquicoccaceae bacterium FCR-1]|uniref:DUF3124 domain-containing protein n=1 Tax=Candidatus Magnetaquiglobus chichijimensis TaxID=3141448 RepID=A0ABQ0C8F5_9PROT
MRVSKVSSWIGCLLSGVLMVPIPDANAMEQPPLSTGQTVYVPVYSSVLHGNFNDRGRPEQALLSSMLSVRNTDLHHAMTITAVDYYDSTGQQIRRYLSKPQLLPHLATADFFVENRDNKGGTGANFIVIWHAEQPIDQPMMETVQVYHWGTQSQAFTSRGQVIHATNPNAKPEAPQKP